MSEYMYEFPTFVCYIVVKTRHTAYHTQNNGNCQNLHSEKPINEVNI